MESQDENRNYSSSNIRMINEKFIEIRERHEDLFMKAIALSSRIRPKRAQEYLAQGVARRISICYRCIENIFHIFPVERINKLIPDELKDIDINLHAFIINIHGIIENLGLTIAYGCGLIDPKKNENQQKHNLGLFNKKFINKIFGPIHDYFSSDIPNEWYRTYSVNYRDALAHRIPAYIPPAGLNNEEVKEYNIFVERMNEIQRTGWTPEISRLLEEIDRLGVANPSFVHSSLENAKVVALHPQILTDFLTVEEMVNIVVDNYDLTIALSL